MSDQMKISSDPVREGFEEWAKEYGHEIARSRFNGKFYAQDECNDSWAAWQAALNFPASKTAVHKQDAERFLLLCSVLLNPESPAGKLLDMGRMPTSLDEIRERVDAGIEVARAATGEPA